MPDTPSSFRARALAVTSLRPGAGKTHVACALSRWLLQRGCQPVPLQLSTRAGLRVACPGGVSLWRPTAMLAEACRLEADPLFESGWESLDPLSRIGDLIIVEAGQEEARSCGLPVLEVERGAAGVRLNGVDVPLSEDVLTPEPWPEMEGLPEWEPAAAPRTGVLSLPHLADFSDLALMRGAEWLTAAGIGQFDFLVAPATTNPAHDALWLRETGLDLWLQEQAAQGAMVVSCGWDVPGARRIEREDLTDYRRLSLLMGRRLPPPLPADETYDRLALWISGWAERSSLLAPLL
ncbi:MAG: hypothetical protein NZR01_14305 [Bryobacteraceae bacterium]|nr:hypothetical protein [Bryobacteraceae bacterium]